MARLRAQSTAQIRSDVAHLLRRSGFGATPARVDQLAAGGYDAAVDRVVGGLTIADPATDAIAAPTFDTASYRDGAKSSAEERKATLGRQRAERVALVTWWMKRMVAADHPAREKAAFLWHDHFATSLTKVKLAGLMAAQRQTIVDGLGGTFPALVRAMAVDPAMLIWLDGRDSTAEAPNENFARELLELFTLGHGAGHHAAQPYTEDDVHDAARALTGWVIRSQGSRRAGKLRPQRHDDGTKTVLGVTGALGLDEIVRVTTEHPATAPHVVSRLWSRLAYPVDPADRTVIELSEAFAADLDLSTLLRAIFLHPDFRSSKARTGLVRMPVDFVVGTLRALGATLPDRALVGAMTALAQIPFAPPDVSGWPRNEAWLSTSSAQARLAFADLVAERTDLTVVHDATPADRPRVLAHLLSLDGWNDASVAAITAAPDAHRATVVAIVSPEHLVA